MKKKYLALILLGAITSFLIYGCGNNQEENNNNNINWAEAVKNVISIEKTDTNGNVDTYTVTCENGYSFSFEVTNGLNGEQGIQGEPGEDGHTPVITIGENGNWVIDGVDTGISSKGEKGDTGEKGDDGLTPFIGDNGNWRIGEIDTGVKAEGSDGLDGQTPYIGENGNWFIGNQDLGISAQGPQGEAGADGIDGETPYIKDGYWWIGDTNTNVKAEGSDGEDGQTPYIGENGNWFIGNQDTGVKAGEQEETFNITFDANGGLVNGQETYVISAEKGSCIENLPTPEKYGAYFRGWFTGDSVNDGQFTKVTPVSYDLTLYARWEEMPRYTVTWSNPHGGILEVDSDILAGSDFPTYDGETPTYDPLNTGTSLTFIGRQDKPDYIWSDVMIIARYEELEKEYTVTFELGEYGEFYNPNDKASIFYYGERVNTPYIILDNVPSNISFDGWYYDANFEKPVNFGVDFVTNDLTLYAKWVKIGEIIPEDVMDITDYLTFYYDTERGGYVVRSYNDIEHYPNVKVPDTYTGEEGTKPVVGIQNTFASNQFIKYVELPDSLEYIGDNAFSSSTIESVKCGDNVESLGDYAFYGTQIEYFDFPKKLKNIGNHCFEDANLKGVDLSLTNVETIGDYGFADNYVLSEVKLCETLKEIGEYGFDNSDIYEIDLSMTRIESIKNCCFYGSSNLQKVLWPDNILSIGDNAFTKTGLINVVIPDSVESISSQAFYCSYELVNVVRPLSVKTLGSGCFGECSKVTIFCEATSQPEGYDPTFAGSSAVYWYSEDNPGSNPGNYWHYNENGEPWKW